jgi:hypothetical protein
LNDVRRTAFSFFSSSRMRAVLSACAVLAAGPAQAAPSATFGIEVGNALLCLNQLNSKYFYDYLTVAFGPPYKTEGGAYWFKASGSIWGVQVTDVLVNDGSSQADFIGAYFKTTPAKLGDAVTAATGIRFSLEDTTTYSPRHSQAGSMIVYNDNDAKMYCAKSKFLVPGPQQ